MKCGIKLGLWSVGLWGVLGCGETSPTGAEGPTVSVNVAALNLVGVGDVVWDIEVVNGATPADVVWRQRLSSSRYGDGRGSATYVGPCDAANGANQNTVRLWVVGVYASPVGTAGSFGEAPPAGAMAFQNPTPYANEQWALPMAQSVTCLPNADAPVRFDVALMRPAEQGFFDIAVNFNDIFCSAKFDCCVENAEGTACVSDRELLHDASGERSTTMVLAFACTAGPKTEVETELYLDALELDCTSPSTFGAGFSSDIVIDPSGPGGNQCTAGGVEACGPRVTSPVADADAYLYQVGVYRGLEQLQSGGVSAQKVYWNVALGSVRKGEGEGVGIEDCWLRTRGTADDANGSGLVDNGVISAGAVYPYVQWEVKLDSCRAEELSPGSGAMVRTEYTKTGATGPTAFAYGYGANMGPASFCASPCVNGTCVGGECLCETGWTGTTCEMNEDDCTVDACGGAGAGTCVDGLGTFTCDCADGYYGSEAQACSLCSPVEHCTAATCEAAGASTCTDCEAGYTLSGGGCVSATPCGLLGQACPAGFTCSTALAAGSSYEAFCVSDGTVGDFGSGAEMVYVPSGTFWMGCNPTTDTNCDSDENPQHEVSLPAYAMDRTEVSAAQYRGCVTADPAGCTLPSAANGSYATYDLAAGKQTHPINNVSWDQASAYCAWLGKRLCTEAEWERGARGGCETVTGTCQTSMRTYPWGNMVPTCSLSNFRLVSGYCEPLTYTANVGGRVAGASPYGALNLSGNVWEWSESWYGPYPEATQAGAVRVIRGGAFVDGVPYFRASRRSQDSPAYAAAGFVVGFRCCRSYP